MVCKFVLRNMMIETLHFNVYFKF